VENQTSSFQDRPQVRETYGEILPNGVVIELVTTDSTDLSLLHGDAQNYQIEPQFQDGLTIYHVPCLEPTVFDATRFPCGVTEYGTPGKLFSKVSDLFCHYMGFSREQAVCMTRVVFCSWFPDCGARPVTLCIMGMDMDQVMRLFQLLHVLCRHPLVVAELSPKLPLILGLTLLVNVPAMSARAGGLWRASNYRGTFIPGARGAIRNIACAKIIFCETEAARRVWGPEAMDIALLPTIRELPSLTEQEQAQLAAEYQPRFLMLRLRSLPRMHKSGAASCQRKFAGFELGADLPACIAQDPEIVKAWTPLVEAHEQELLARRSLDPRVAIVEAVWAAAHKEKEMSTEQITQRVNALLHDRGENLTYNSKEIGWKLSNLALVRCHNGKCKVVRFSREMRRQIHQLAAQFGLKLPKVADCADCKDTQLIAHK
jgi:hypothetical protein